MVARDRVPRGAGQATLANAVVGERFHVRRAQLLRRGPPPARRRMGEKSANPVAVDPGGPRQNNTPSMPSRRPPCRIARRGCYVAPPVRSITVIRPMRSFIRKIFGSSPARFSDDVRAVTGYSQSLAVACGATRIDSAHLLAAVARHPRGDEVLAGHAKEIFGAVCGDKRVATPTPIPPKGRLESEDEFKQVIQALAKNALAAPKRSRERAIELEDVVRTLSAMPESRAYAVLQRFGLASSGGAAAG